MKYKIQTVKIKVPKGADEKSLDKKIGRWANTKAYGIAWSVCEGLASVDFFMHTGLLKEDPKEFWRACKVLKRIVANSAPKPPTIFPAVPTYKSQPIKQFAIGQEVRVSGTNRLGVILAAFQEPDFSWTYVVNLNIGYKSEAHLEDSINRAVFAGSFLESI